MNYERLMKIILRPHVSEKATILADKHKQFVFRVLSCSSKDEIKEAVETLFKVEVEAVKVMNVKPKARRFKQIAGWRKKWKKAYVSLKQGHDINFGVAEGIGGA